MPIAKKHQSTATMHKSLQLALSCALLAGIAYGQATQAPSEKLSDATDPAHVAEVIARVKSGEIGNSLIETIATARAVEAIPILKDQFARSQVSSEKEKIASALVRLGDKDEAYWNLLVKQATTAIESDAPDFVRIDENDKASNQQPSQEFIDWVKAKKLDPQTAASKWLYGDPGSVIDLGVTGDPRAIPLLRRALLSHNFLIQHAAAQGLAEIRDKDSILLIIAACKKGPADSSALIAESLVFFDDPQAQSAVDTYIPKDIAKLYRESRAAGFSPYGEKRVVNSSKSQQK